MTIFCIFLRQSLILWGRSWTHILLLQLPGWSDYRHVLPCLAYTFLFGRVRWKVKRVTLVDVKGIIIDEVIGLLVCAENSSKCFPFISKLRPRKQAHVFPALKMRWPMEEINIVPRGTELASLCGGHILLAPALAIFYSYSKTRLWISLTSISFYCYHFRTGPWGSSSSLPPPNISLLNSGYTYFLSFQP